MRRLAHVSLLLSWFVPWTGGDAAHAGTSSAGPSSAASAGAGRQEAPAAAAVLDPATAAAAVTMPSAAPAAEDATSSTTPLSAGDAQAQDAPSPASTSDRELLAAVLALEQAFGIADAQLRAVGVGNAVQAIGALHDVRAVPILLRLSRGTDASMRLSALGALSTFVDQPEVLDRLRETQRADAPAHEAAVALPALLLAAQRAPRADGVPCPSGGSCVDDGVLLRTFLDYARVEPQARAGAVGTIASLHDVRTVPFLWRLTFAGDDAVRAAALDGLAALAEAPLARERLLDVLEEDGPAEKLVALRGLATLPDDDVTTVLFARRASETVPAVRDAIVEVLRVRAAAQLQRVEADEKALAEAEAARPRPFDASSRIALSIAAGLGGAVGGAASAGVVGDTVTPGSGACYGAWGGCAGGASAAALTWFGLSDRQLEGPDVVYALSMAGAGALSGLMIPLGIGGAATSDLRHSIYAAAGGGLLGMSLSTVAALAWHPTNDDVAETNLGVLATIAMTDGVLLLIPSDNPDARILAWSTLGATTVGAVGASLLATQLHLDVTDVTYAVENGVMGYAAGGLLGAAADSFRAEAGTATTTAGAFGGGLLGAAIGIGIGGALGHFDRNPSSSGMIYQAWSGVVGGSLGGATGLLVDGLGGSVEPHPAWHALGAGLGVLGGSAMTAAFPDGVSQDEGDIALQALGIGLGLYHGGALAAAGNVDPRLVLASSLGTPALVSVALAHAAPVIDASLADVTMIAGMMGTSAYLASMGLLSAQLRSTTGIGSLPWVLGTSLAMDAGIAAGIALDLSGVDHIGWRTTYVLSVAAGTTLLLSLPGSLVAAATNGAVTTPDVLLASTAVGAVLGLVTMPLIDFRIAPDLGTFSLRPSTRAASTTDAATGATTLQLSPAVLPVVARNGTTPTSAWGVVGRF